MKKKLLAVALSAVLAVSMLAGCGDKGNTSTSGSTSTKSSTSKTDTKKTETSTESGGATYEFDIKV